MGVIFVLKKFKIEKKIIFTFTSILFLTQLVTGFLLYYINNNIYRETTNLSKYTSEIGTNSLKTQNQEYLKNISSSGAKISDSFFEEISNNLNNFCDSTQKIYQDKKNINLNNEILVLPDLININLNSSEKAYVIDSSESTENNILVYNSQEYNNYSQNLYITNKNDWNVLTPEERTEILKNYCVVSKNKIPNEMKKELLLLNNLKYISEPIFNNNQNISSVYLGTETGIFYRYSSENSREKFDPRTRPWYTDAINNTGNIKNNIIWQSAYVSKSTGKLCMTCSKTFKNSSGEILGVVAIDMNLDDINNYINNTKINNNNHNFILDNNKNIIINPDFNISQENISNNITQNSGIFNININDKNYFLSYNLLENTNWIFVTAISEEYIIEPINNMTNLIQKSNQDTVNSINKINYNIIIMFLICVLVIYFISVKLAKNISKPIINLSKKSKEIGAGNFSLKMPIESDDEIGDLAKSFNIMTENLEKYINNLAKTTAEKEKIHSELMIAKKIQSSMLPCIFPAFPEHKNIDIYALMDPAREVGGDFYDFFLVDQDNLALVVADVSDKGISAALFMVVAKILIQNELQNHTSPEETLRKVNEKLCENNTAGMFVTCFISLINIKSGEFTYSNAGHNPPIIYKKNSNTCINIEKPRGLVLGGMNNIKYKQNHDTLLPGDILLFYTDGVTEALNAKKELFSEQKLKNILINSKNKSNIKNLVTEIRSEIEIFSGAEARSDDITILGFKLSE